MSGRFRAEKKIDSQLNSKPARVLPNPPRASTSNHRLGSQNIVMPEAPQQFHLSKTAKGIGHTCGSCVYLTVINDAHVWKVFSNTKGEIEFYGIW